MSSNELPGKLELSLLATLNNCVVTKEVSIGDTVFGKRVNATWEGDLTGDIISGKMSGIKRYNRILCMIKKTFK